MFRKPKAVFNWSGGKDSALALHKVLQAGKYVIVALLTTVDAQKLTSSLHNIPLRLLQHQADSIGIPLYTVSRRQLAQLMMKVWKRPFLTLKKKA